MKLEELMLNDWVLYNGNPCKVARISERLFLEKDGKVFYAPIEKISPLPLTKEILEKNGVEDFDCSFHFPEDDCLWLEMNWEEDGLKWTVNCNEYDILPLDYVHELQHALRLCGIDKDIIL